MDLADPPLKPSRVHHSCPSADLVRPHPSNGSIALLSAPDLAALHPSAVTKPHLSNGDYHRPPASARAHQSSNGELSRAKGYIFHGDPGRPVRLPRLLLLLLNRRFFILGSFLILLLLAFLAFPLARVYPALKHPFLVDLAEQAERAQINNILDGTWNRAAVHSRYPFMYDRYKHEDHYSERFYERRRPSGLRDSRLPAQLNSPRYAPFWPEFRSALRSWVQNKRYDPNIMSQLLSLVKDPMDKHFMKSPNHTVAMGKPYKTCAVVGNSGILLNQSYASLIDSHDMVMRLNNARTRGFEQYVGSKTTLSFINSNILHTCTRRTGCFCHPYGPDVPIILYICQVVHLMDVSMCGATQGTPVMVTDARFDTLCARIVKYYSLKRFIETMGRRLEEWSDAHEGTLFHYSSGMQAILLAVGICEKVSIFGFGKSETSKHHYHTTQRAELRLHDYAAEYDFYQDLVTQNAQIIPFLNEAGFSLPSVHIYW